MQWIGQVLRDISRLEGGRFNINSLEISKPPKNLTFKRDQRWSSIPW
jgi:hypothetical protein